MESKSKLREKIKGLSGVDILTDTGAYKSTYEILLSIGKVWKNINSMDQGALVELLAGKNRANTLAAILNNTEDLEKALISAKQSAGSALKENSVFLDSITGKVTLFQNATQSMWNNFIDSRVVKFIVDAGTGIIKFLDKIGLIPTVLGGGAIIGMIKGRTGLPGLFKNITELAIDAGDAIQEYGKKALETAKNQKGLGEALNDLFNDQKNKIAKSFADKYNQGELSNNVFDDLIQKRGIQNSVKVFSQDEFRDWLTQIDGLKDEFGNLDQAKADSIITNLKLNESNKALTADMIRGRLVTQGLGDAEIEAALKAKGLTGANTTLAASFKNLWTSVWPLLAILGATVVITGVIHAIDKLVVTTDEYIEKLDSLRTELQGTQSELESLNSELDETNSRIKELESMGPLSFTDDEELKRLKAENKERQRSIDLLTLEEKKKKKEVIETAEKGFENFYNKKGTGAAISRKGMIRGRSMSNAEKINKNEELIGKTRQEIESYRARNIIANKNGAEDEKALWKLKNKLEKYQGNRDKTIETLGDILDGIEYGDSEITDHALDLYRNLQNKDAIDNNGQNAKQNAINDILGRPQYASITEDVGKIIEQAPEDLESANEQIVKLIDNNAKLKEDIEASGLEVKDIANSFTQIGKTDDIANAFDSEEFEKISEAIDKIQSSFSALSDAVKQYNENGFLTLDNLQALMELEPKYLSALQFENGQLVLNQEVISGLIQTRLDEAKASAVQRLVTELNTVAEKSHSDAINNTKTAMDESSNSVINYVNGLSEAAQAAIVAAGATDVLNEAMGKAVASDASADEIQKIWENYGKIIEAVDNVGANLSSSFSSVVGGSDDVLGSLQSKYERKIKNLESQQTYLENQISLLEAKEAGVSKSYYEEQIGIEERKLALYKKQREELKGMAMTNDVADALWETEHAIQDSVLHMVELRQKIIDLYKTAFDGLISAYDSKDDLLSDQQNYIDKYMQLLELQKEAKTENGVTALIDFEKEKMAENEKELQDLMSLRDEYINDNSIENGTQTWVELEDKIRAVEEAIIDNKIQIAQYNEDLRQLHVGAFDSVKTASDDISALYGDQQSYIEKQIQLAELRDEVVASGTYKSQIEIENKALEANQKELENLIGVRDRALSSGAIKEGTDEWKKMQSEIRGVELAIQDITIKIEEYNKKLKEISVEGFNLVRGAFDSKNSFFSNQQRYIEGYVDLLGEMNINVSDEIYQKLIEIEQDKRESNVSNLIDARERFADIEAVGYTAADEEWQNAYQKIVDIEKAIQDSDIAMAKWNQTIKQIDIDQFNKFLGRIDDVKNELQHLYDMFSKEKIANEDGTWTAEGVSALGVLYHQMELAQKKSDEYRNKIAELNETYKDGSTSEQEYYDRLQELKNGQWDAIDAYESAKDAIIDLEEARIDQVENGINKEIKAYSELIELRKKELDSERELFEFKKNVEKQSQNIAEIERKIASISGSNSLADIAERRRLEKSLREEQENLNDTYRSRGYDQKAQALDDEGVVYENSKNRYLESLRETLDDTEKVIAQKIQEALVNADVTLDAMNGVAEERGVTLSDSLMLPWVNAAAQATAFKDSASFDIDSLINDEGIMTIFGAEVEGKIGNAFANGGIAVQSFGTTVSDIIDALNIAVKESTSPLTEGLSLPWNDTSKDGGPINTFSKKSGNAIDAAVDKAKSVAEGMKNDLRNPWDQATNATNIFDEEAQQAIIDSAEVANRNALQLTSDITTPWIEGSGAVNTFRENVRDAYSSVIADAQNAAREINRANASITPPSYVGGGTGAKGTTPINSNNFNGDTVTVTKTNGNADSKTSIKMEEAWHPSSKNYQEVIGTSRYLNENKEIIDGDVYIAANGVYYKSSDLKSYPISKGNDKEYYVDYKTPAYKKTYYAKGTLGTKKDEWAITDEFGPELVLVPGKDGNLQYMRAGTSVIPSDISANLIEWGKIDPSMMNSSIKTTGTNIISNAINKPEFNMSFDSLVHVDRCDEGTMKDLEKMVDTKITQFTKQMNYAISKYR